VGCPGLPWFSERGWHIYIYIYIYIYTYIYIYIHITYNVYAQYRYYIHIHVSETNKKVAWNATCNVLCMFVSVCNLCATVRLPYYVTTLGHSQHHSEHGGRTQFAAKSLDPCANKQLWCCIKRGDHLLIHIYIWINIHIFSKKKRSPDATGDNCYGPTIYGIVIHLLLHISCITMLCRLQLLMQQPLGKVPAWTSARSQAQAPWLQNPAVGKQGGREGLQIKPSRRQSNTLPTQNLCPQYIGQGKHSSGLTTGWGRRITNMNAGLNMVYNKATRNVLCWRPYLRACRYIEGIVPYRNMCVTSFKKSRVLISNDLVTNSRISNLLERHLLVMSCALLTSNAKKWPQFRPWQMSFHRTRNGCPVPKIIKQAGYKPCV